jgi:hypothetical protein
MVLIGLTLRLAVIPFDTIEDLMDAQHIHGWEQGNVARALVAGRGFGSPFLSDQTSAIMPPVYPLIVAATFEMFGVHTAHAIFAVHAFDCLTNALACIPVFLVARRSFGSKAGLVASWAWVFFPYGIYFAAAWAWSTHLLMLSLLGLFFLAQQMEVSPRLGLWAGFGLLAGFAGLCEPTALVPAAFLMAFAASRLVRNGLRWLAPGILASLVLAGTLAPWLIRDARQFGRFIPMRDSMGLELWMGNNGYSERFTSDQLHPLHNAAELAAYNNMGELKYMDWKSAQAHAYIAAHQDWFAGMSLRRAVYLWTGYWSFDSAYLQMEPMDPFNVPFQTCLTLLALAGLGVAWRQARWEAMRYAGVLFLFPIVYYFSHPEPYHMRTLDPLIVILDCLTIIQAVAWWTARKKALGR